MVKLLSFALYWVATCAVSTSSKLYPSYYQNTDILLYKSSLIGVLISLFGLE